MRYTCKTKEWTPETSVEQVDIVKKLCKGEKCETVTPGRELFGDTECPGVHPPDFSLNFQTHVNSFSFNFHFSFNCICT